MQSYFFVENILNSVFPYGFALSLSVSHSLFIFHTLRKTMFIYFDVSKWIKTNEWENAKHFCSPKISYTLSQKSVTCRKHVGFWCVCRRRGLIWTEISFCSSSSSSNSQWPSEGRMAKMSNQTSEIWRKWGKKVRDVSVYKRYAFWRVWIFSRSNLFVVLICSCALDDTLLSFR